MWSPVPNMTMKLGLTPLLLLLREKKSKILESVSDQNKTKQKNIYWVAGPVSFFSVSDTERCSVIFISPS